MSPVRVVMVSLTRALKAPTLRDAVERLGERARAQDLHPGAQQHAELHGQPRHTHRRESQVTPGRNEVSRSPLARSKTMLAIGLGYVGAHRPPRTAVDGKTSRGARADGGQAPHLVAAVTHTGMVQGQRQVLEKSNEITAFQPPLNDLPLADVVV